MEVAHLHIANKSTATNTKYSAPHIPVIKVRKKKKNNPVLQ